MPIYLKGQYALFQRIERLGKEVQERVAAEVQATAHRVAEKARQRVPRDTGALAGAIDVLDLPHKGIWGMAAQVRAIPWYAFPVEFGYKGRPGQGNRQHRLPIRKIGGKWRVVPALEAWALRHGKPPFAVAKKLLREGHKPQPFFFKVQDEEAGPFIERVKRIIGEEAPRALGPAPDPVGVN